jgi:membrane protein implicated in regulation of membrane protease activity
VSQVEDSLGWEAEQRPRAAMAAILSGLLVLTSNFLVQAAYRDYPGIDPLEALGEAATGESGALKAAQVRYVDDHAGEIIASTVAVGLGFIATAFTLHYLWRAVMARRDNAPRAIRILALAGPVTLAVGSLMYSLGRVISAGSFDGGSAQAAREALAPPVAQAGQVLVLFGTFGLALAIVFVALNAMRVGLLSRFLGILGVIAGVLWILPLDQLGLIRSLWLVALGVMLFGRNRPPAWNTGRAEPWPSQQELRERREALRGEHAVEDDAAEESGDAPVPAAAKRKRKRRR